MYQGEQDMNEIYAALGSIYRFVPGLVQVMMQHYSYIHRQLLKEVLDRNQDLTLCIRSSASYDAEL